MLCEIRKHCVLFILLILVTSMNIVLAYCLVVSFLAAPSLVEASCGVVPITQWGKSPSAHITALKKPVDLVVVTHTVTGACDNDQECERIANAIRNTQRGQGNRDIGLSFLVGENGKIYEGAGWRVGAHTRGYNDQSVSLSFIGDFRTRVPNKAALDAAQKFLSCSLNERSLFAQYRLVGHRQLIATISPGDALQNLIQTWPHWVLNVGTRPH